MKNNIKKLAEAISDLRFINKNELEGMIEVYFKIWKEEQDLKNSKPSSLLNLKTELDLEKDRLFFKKTSLESQVDRANLAKKKNKVIDDNWYVNIKTALKITNYQYKEAERNTTIASRLIRIEQIEKRNTRQEIFANYLSDLIADKYGKEQRTELTTKAGKLTEDYFNLKK